MTAIAAAADACVRARVCVRLILRQPDFCFKSPSFCVFGNTFWSGTTCEIGVLGFTGQWLLVCAHAITTKPVCPQPAKVLVCP